MTSEVTLLKEAAAADGPDVDELVVRSQRGDQQAFNRLIASQYHFIFRVAFRVLGHKSDAEDVTQTVCLRLATSLSSFDHRASFTSWLYRVTMNVARDFLRAQGRRKRLVDGAAILASEHVNAEQDAQRPVEDIWSVVRSLPEKQRDAVILVHGEELSQEEAARIMSCKKVTVAWHLHNARKTLRDLL
ncbi:MULTISPECIES: RNA polymerase sigma factor [unclassified Devosia]|uniref:RNA polymerase sigma factor n=1 Tax=unclassified Devosia TaxID=196773 RepID=UPI0023D81F34|nr:MULTISPECIES: RNA polymerase sigma factor [unclassified Devosia]WEJ35042.1 RNA polymerase sigma factor [Devosia sp. SD17-2]